MRQGVRSGQPDSRPRERNADHLLEEGAAIRCNNLPVLAYKIDRLLDEPERLRACVKTFAVWRPERAYQIVAKLQSLGGTLNEPMTVGMTGQEELREAATCKSASMGSSPRCCFRLAA